MLNFVSATCFLVKWICRKFLLSMLASYMPCPYLVVHSVALCFFQQDLIEIYNSNWDGNGTP